MKKTDFVLGKSIGKLRNHIYRLQRLRYNTTDINITVEESIILNIIHEKSNQIMQNIAFETGKNKSVVMRMIDSLENKGLVQREVNPKDRRENLLVLTPLGELIFKKQHKLEMDLANDLLDGIPDEDILTFYQVVEKIEQKASSFLNNRN